MPITPTNQTKSSISPVKVVKTTLTQAVYGIGVYGMCVYGAGSVVGVQTNQTKNVLTATNQAKS